MGSSSGCAAGCTVCGPACREDPCDVTASGKWQRGGRLGPQEDAAKMQGMKMHEEYDTVCREEDSANFAGTDRVELRTVRRAAKKRVGDACRSRTQKRKKRWSPGRPEPVNDGIEESRLRIEIFHVGARSHL